MRDNIQPMASLDLSHQIMGHTGIIGKHRPESYGIRDILDNGIGILNAILLCRDLEIIGRKTIALAVD